ncbi:MAG: c-type cytochrome [Rhizomicrobium sp.]
MNWFMRLALAAQIAIGSAAAIGLILLGWVLWLVTEPGPMDFARGNAVELGDYHGGDPTGVPAALAHESLIERGEYLARAADCQSCHTAMGGVPFAGGRAFNLPFGTIYSPNITADKDTGIGGWSDADFLNALHEGVDDEGERLYPAMPYASFTQMTDADALAIKAYLFSLAPVHAEGMDNKLAFPFNQRWLIGLWNLFFNPDMRFEPRTDRSAQWNRGAYIAEALAHCGECHTPRNLAFALDNRDKFGGARISGWRAYNISGDGPTGVGRWSDAELAAYLSTGHARGRGTASGPMGEAVDESFGHLAPGDIAGLVTYLRSVPGISSDLPATLAGPAPASHREPPGLDPRGEKLFAGSCASCHGWTGKSPIWEQATLTGARAVNDPSADNVAQIVIEGASHETAHGTVFMPAFGSALSDDEIAALANYVTGRFGAQGSTIGAKRVAKLRAQASH